MQINDGTGLGYVAKVTSGNRLAVDVDEGAKKAAKDGALYTISTTSTKPSLTITGTGGILMHLENASGSSKSLVIDEILASTNTAGMNCTVLLNHVRGTIADETELDANSTNTATAHSAPAGANAWVWDEANHGIGGLTGGTRVLTVLLGIGTTSIASGSRYVVAPGGSLSIHMKTAGEGAAAIRFYEVDA